MTIASRDTILIRTFANAVADTVRDALGHANLRVVLLTSDENVPRAANDMNARLVLMDFRTPQFDGLSAMENMRAHSDIPVIMMLPKPDQFSEAFALNMGADDVVTQHTPGKIIAQRIETVLRRARVSQNMREHLAPAPEILGDGTMELNAETFICSWKGSRLQLTSTEFKILSTLVKSPDQLKSRDMLRVAADIEDHKDQRGIDSHIKRLRNQFRAVDPDFNGIKTVYGMGYMYRSAAKPGIPAAVSPK